MLLSVGYSRCDNVIIQWGKKQNEWYVLIFFANKHILGILTWTVRGKVSDFPDLTKNYQLWETINRTGSLIPYWNFFKRFWRIQFPCFELLVTSALGFKARVGGLLCFIACMEWNLQIRLWCNICWPLGGQHGSRAVPIHVLAKKYWLGLSPGSSETTLD